MNAKTFYHVVTDKPMYLGQHINFNENNHNGVYDRVMDKLDVVKTYIIIPINMTLRH